MATSRTPPVTRSKILQLQQSANKSILSKEESFCSKAKNNELLSKNVKEKKNLTKTYTNRSFDKALVTNTKEIEIIEVEDYVKEPVSISKRNINSSNDRRTLSSSNNIYSNLTIDADGPEEDDRLSDKFKKKPYTPIILTRKLNNLKDTIRKIKGWITNKIHFRSVNDGISIITYFKADYDTVIFKFKELGFEYYTFTPMEHRSKKLVIKGISPLYEISDILEDLKHQTDNINNIQVLSISNINRHLKNKEDNSVNRTPSNKYLVYFSSDSDINYVTKNIIHVCDHKISWEPYIKKFFATQCRRCQRFGHAAINCNQSFRCVKCTSLHEPGECKKLLEEKPKCINCNGEHSANYKKCKSFIDYSLKNEIQRTTYHKKIGASSPFVKPTLSYRNALISNSNLRTENPPLIENDEHSNTFLFMINEINLLFNTSIEELMLKIKAFMPTYNNSTDQSSKKCLMIGFLSQFV